MRGLLLALAGLGIAACGAHAPAADAPGRAFVVTPIATFHEPWAMTFLPDGRLLVTEKRGALRLLDVNTRHAEGMLTSILVGLDDAEASGADAILLQPVDHPLIDPATVDAVIGALGRGSPIAVPSHDGRRGHPGGFARQAWEALRAVAPDEGARGVLARHPEWIEHVPAGEECLLGVNTNEDYERIKQRR